MQFFQNFRRKEPAELGQSNVGIFERCCMGAGRFAISKAKCAGCTNDGSADIFWRREIRQ